MCLAIFLKLLGFPEDLIARLGLKKIHKILYI